MGMGGYNIIVVRNGEQRGIMLKIGLISHCLDKTQQELVELTREFAFTGK